MLLWRKTDETIWNPFFLREPPLSINHLISEQFSHDPCLSEFQKQEIPLILGGEGVGREEGGNYGRSSVFVVNFEHISQLVLVFLLLTLSR